LFPHSYDGAMRIVRLGPGDENAVLGAADLFDALPTEAATKRFLASEGHHLLVALEERPVGFVSGVEMTHPDKGTEMFLYELSVHPERRNRGVGRALVRALADVARTNGCYGMWVLTDSNNAPALAAYRAAGAGESEPNVMLEWRFEAG
jgi:ribosomal protein S18 acetylase RimI-like enzyme